MDSFSGVRIAVSNALVGSTKAVQFGDGPIHVSPAMWDLMKHADKAELRRLLESIHVVRIPKPTAGGLGDYMFTAPKL